MKNLLESGRSIICIGPSFPSPELVEFLGYLTFDAVFIDAEHGVIGPEKAQEMVRAANVVGMATMTRVPKNDPAVILSYLETGTKCVLVPHVTTAAEAQEAVRAAMYHPKGIRGSHSGTRAANYGVTQTGEEYFTRANRETAVAVMIEDVSAVENIEEIVSVPGVDACMLGPGDLSMSMGYPGQPNHPEVQAMVEQAFQKIRQAGVAAGTVAGDGAHVRRLFDHGYQMAIVSASVLLAGAARQLISTARES